MVTMLHDNDTNAALADLDERELDRTWEADHNVLVSLDERLERITELTESMRYHLGREEFLTLDEILSLYDKTNAMIAEAISEAFVIDDLGYDVTFAQFDSLTKPAVADNEMVLTASEYSKDLDDSYDVGFEDGEIRGADIGFDEGIDAGILLTSRVLRVLNAQVVDTRTLRG